MDTRRVAASGGPWITPSYSVRIEPLGSDEQARRSSLHYSLLAEEDDDADLEAANRRRAAAANVKLRGRVLRLVASFVLLPPAVLLCILFSPVWLALKLIDWTTCGRECIGQNAEEDAAAKKGGGYGTVDSRY
ncbi:hypothetical protein ACA1_276500 [Acanthamoeba castellanii str. Neff]|uniref:Uncharacterized protein n=1 Tax=Acanthamoeba castellanii (strain ATCC 30010 / Neff) TaxID=1257118 RepID=L8GQI2_ACACF|nr:hypothetical protein ACA1_276500 [Acanthamoeba castellanii str. Neff]